MKNIIDLYETSLLGNIDDTIEKGDNYIASVNQAWAKFKLMVDTKDNWKLHNRKGFNFHYQYAKCGIICDALIKYLGYDNVLDSISISINRDVVGKLWDLDVFIDRSRGGIPITKTIRAHVMLPGNYKLPDVLKYMSSITTDIDTFKNWIEDNKIKK